MIAVHAADRAGRALIVVGSLVQDGRGPRRTPTTNSGSNASSPTSSGSPEPSRPDDDSCDYPCRDTQTVWCGSCGAGSTPLPETSATSGSPPTRRGLPRPCGAPVSSTSTGNLEGLPTGHRRPAQDQRADIGHLRHRTNGGVPRRRRAIVRRHPHGAKQVMFQNSSQHECHVEEADAVRAGRCASS